MRSLIISGRVTLAIDNPIPTNSGDPNVAQNSSGSPAIMAAIVLGISIVGSSYLLTSSVDRTSNQMKQTFANLQTIEGAPAKPAARQAAAPNPGKIYKVAVGNAPFKGPKSAKITIVEFSDFQ